MTGPPDAVPTDADRIIAAQRDEARRTRKLLIWLLVGIPACVALVWFIVAAIVISNRSPASGGGNAASFDQFDSTTTTTPDPCIGHIGQAGYTWCGDGVGDSLVAPPAMMTFVVTDSTMCSAISDWFATVGPNGPIDPKDAPFYGGSGFVSNDPVVTWLISKGLPASDAPMVKANCGKAPTLTVAAVLNQRGP
jgi:hypothetical protein